MNKLPAPCLLSFFFCLAAISSLHASVYFVAPKGDDAAAGTIDAPFASLQKGHDKSTAGDTVYIRGGTYTISAKNATENCGVLIKKSGESDKKRIYFWAYKDEVPVLDFANLSLGSATGAGIRINGSEWLHFKGLEICNVPQPSASASNNGIWANPCSHTIFERMNFHHNMGPGLSIAYGTGGNLILNCDSHDNYDELKNGEDGDGFGLHYQTKGDTTIYRGCRSWWNSDDGYDLFSQKFPVLIENCWAYGNGYINSGKGTGANGSGFKMGNSFTKTIRHTIRNCVSWKNRSQGFYANHSPGGTNWYNNTSYNNGAQFDMFSDSVLSGSIVHILRNNISFPKKINNPGASDMKFNTWDLNITPVNTDFLSVSDSGWTGTRRPDGSLPDIAFLKLKTGSAMIDKGTDIGLPFVDNAPDLGAHEFGATTIIRNRQTYPEILPAIFLVGGNDFQKVQLFDLTGRRQGAGMIIHSFRPIIYYKQQSGCAGSLTTVITRSCPAGYRSFRFEP
jgi:hypothetical protein